MTGVGDAVPWLDAALASPWLLAVLLAMVVVDGPCPFLPSEPLLFAAAARALGDGDVAMIAGVVAAAMVGSLIGDFLLYGLGRGSVRIAPAKRSGVGGWVHRHLHRRPIVALAAVRIVPGGRLVSVTAAGRVGLPTKRFLPATVTSSMVWTAYMTGLGLALSEVTGGDPVLSILASLLLATLVAGAASLARRLRRVWLRRRAVAAVPVA